MIKFESKSELIVLGIQEKLSEAGVDFVDFRELISKEAGVASPRPCANISVNQATYKRITMNNVFNCSMLVSLFLCLAELDEEENRRGTLKLIGAIDEFLFHADVGVDLQDRLEPAGFNNITHQEYMDAGFMLYQLNYKCSYNTKTETEQDNGIITMIYNKYFLQKPSDDGVTDSEGRVDLDQIGSGDLHVADLEGEDIDGGTPFTEHEEDETDIYGGTPEST